MCCKSPLLPLILSAHADNIIITVQLQLHVPVSIASTIRFAMAWAIIRLRHPLLASKVDMPRGRYDEAQFMRVFPSPPETSHLKN